VHIVGFSSNTSDMHGMNIKLSIQVFIQDVCVVENVIIMSSVVCRVVPSYFYSSYSNRSSTETAEIYYTTKMKLHIFDQILRISSCLPGV
jgi:hypothetical protein